MSIEHLKAICRFKKLSKEEVIKTISNHNLNYLKTKF